MTKFQKKLWGGIAVIALLTPLGLIIPAIFQGGLGGGDAWGEWEPDTLKKMIGFVPDGFKSLHGLWPAPCKDYNFAATSNAGQLLSYIGSGIIGIVVAGLMIYLIARLTIRHEK